MDFDCDWECFHQTIPEAKIATDPINIVLLLSRDRPFVKVNALAWLAAADAMALVATVTENVEAAQKPAPATSTAANVDAVELIPRRESRTCNFSRDRSTRIRAAFSVRPSATPTSFR